MKLVQLLHASKSALTPCLAIAIVLSTVGCATSGVANSAGVPTREINPSVAGPVAGVGIEGQDIIAMTDQMIRDMLSNQTLAGRAKPPRVVIDSRLFKNEGSQAINRDIITNRLRVNLNRAAQGRMTFITAEDTNVVQAERDLKRSGATDVGTTGLTKAMFGGDYQLRGSIATQDSRNPKTGMIQRYNQITFEMIDLETRELVWGGLYEFARTAADDVVYR